MGGEQIPVPGVFIPVGGVCSSDYGLLSETYNNSQPIKLELFLLRKFILSREYDDPLGKREGAETQRAAPGHPVQNAERGRQQVLRRLRGERCNI